MTTERFSDGIQISTKITKDATGIALTVITAGAASARTQGTQEASPASRIPAAVPMRNPRRILIMENPMDRQKSAWVSSSASRMSTAAGEASRISCPTAMLAACHTAIQNRTAAAFPTGPLFLSRVIEIISRYFSAHGLRILLL